MAERETVESEGRPVLSGLLALVGVGLAVGLIVGLAALIGTRMLGFDGDTVSAETTNSQSMYLPKPSKTEGPTGPLITLVPEPSSGSSQPEPSETKPSKKPERQISLSASQTEVAPMEQIDLTGVYPRGEGRVLQVEKFVGGNWQDFPVTAVVSNETFTTFVQTSSQGVNRFRVVDNDSGTSSNDVRVTVG